MITRQLNVMFFQHASPYGFTKWLPSLSNMNWNIASFHQVIKNVRDSSFRCFAMHSFHGIHSRILQAKLGNDANPKQYFNQVAMKASKIAMRSGPKEAWEAVRLLEKGSTAHHRPPHELHF
jgi:hypothetical protein